MQKTFLSSILFFSILAAALSWAAPAPTTMNYQGYLADKNGKPLPDGDYDMTFRIFKKPAGGTALWTEARTGDSSVDLSSGRFNVILGSITPLFHLNYTSHYLEITVASYGTLAPRIPLVSVPYANRAGNIDAMAALSGDVAGTTDTQTLTGKTFQDSTFDGAAVNNTIVGSTGAAKGAFTALEAAGDLTVEGQMLRRVMIDGTEKTTSYTMTAEDDIILADTSSGLVLVTLSRAAGNSGRTCTVKLKKGGNMLAILAAPGETINKATNILLQTEGVSVQMVSDGSNWQIVDDTGNVIGQLMFGSQINGDLFVGGSTCIGFDCVNNEDFSADTLKLKENNLRIYFKDTSSTSSFPSNDWRITANDSANGGRNYFSIDDVDGETSGILVGRGGNVGIGMTDLPQGRLEVAAPSFSGTGTVTTVTADGTGTISTSPELLLSGIISTSGTRVTGSGTYFERDFFVGLEITAAGETRTITAITSDTEVEVDLPWTTDLVDESFTHTGTRVIGTDTSFMKDLAVRGEITAGGETKIIYSIWNDNQLYTYATWSPQLTDEGYTLPGNLLTGSGTAFNTEAVAGYQITVGGVIKRITAINSDTELEVDSNYNVSLTGEAIAFTKPGLLVTNDGKVGIGAVTPDNALEIEFSPDVDVEIGQGTAASNQTFFTLRSPGGTKYHVQAADNGDISASTAAP